MEKEIRDRFNDSILDTAIERYAIDPGRIALLDGFESFMYEFSRDDGDFILRLGHSRRRTPADSRAPLRCREPRSTACL